MKDGGYKQYKEESVGGSIHSNFTAIEAVPQGALQVFYKWHFSSPNTVQQFQVWVVEGGHNFDSTTFCKKIIKTTRHKNHFLQGLLPIIYCSLWVL